MRIVALIVVLSWGCADSPPPRTGPLPSTTPSKGFTVSSAVSREPAEAGREAITGKVRIVGKSPRRPPPPPQACDTHKRGNVTCEEWCIDADGALANVFLMVQGVEAPFPPPPVTPITIVQWCTLWQPRVVAVQVGQPLVVVNGEEVFHNFHSVPKRSAAFNRGMPRKGVSVTLTFAEPEPAIRLKCDVHPWEAAWVHVVNHPFFAVTGANGEFEINELPAGHYELTAWHEKFGSNLLDVRIETEDKKDTIVNITFDMPLK